LPEQPPLPSLQRPRRRHVDPDQVLALRELVPNRPRGIVASVTTRDRLAEASPAQRRDMTHLRHFFRTQPDFVPSASTTAGRSALDPRNSSAAALLSLDRAHTGAARAGSAVRRSDHLEGSGRTERSPHTLEVGAAMHDHLRCT